MMNFVEYLRHASLSAASINNNESDCNRSIKPPSFTRLLPRIRALNLALACDPCLLFSTDYDNTCIHHYRASTEFHLLRLAPEPRYWTSGASYEGGSTLVRHQPLAWQSSTKDTPPSGSILYLHELITSALTQPSGGGHVPEVRSTLRLETTKWMPCPKHESCMSEVKGRFPIGLWRRHHIGALVVPTAWFLIHFTLHPTRKRLLPKHLHATTSAISASAVVEKSEARVVSDHLNTCSPLTQLSPLRMPSDMQAYNATCRTQHDFKPILLSWFCLPGSPCFSRLSTRFLKPHIAGFYISKTTYLLSTNSRLIVRSKTDQSRRSLLVASPLIHVLFKTVHNSSSPYCSIL